MREVEKRSGPFLFVKCITKTTDLSAKSSDMKKNFAPFGVNKQILPRLTNFIWVGNFRKNSFTF